MKRTNENETQLIVYKPPLQFKPKYEPLKFWFAKNTCPIYFLIDGQHYYNTEHPSYSKQDG